MQSPLRALKIATIALGLFCAASGFAQTAAPAAKAAMADTKMAAPGGGAGKVWVNSGSKRYHCEGTKFYGKTKAGEYMAEADAKTKGYHGVKGKDCPK